MIFAEGSSLRACARTRKPRHPVSAASSSISLYYTCRWTFTHSASLFLLYCLFKFFSKELALLYLLRL